MRITIKGGFGEGNFKGTGGEEGGDAYLCGFYAVWDKVWGSLRTTGHWFKLRPSSYSWGLFDLISLKFLKIYW